LVGIYVIHDWWTHERSCPVPERHLDGTPILTELPSRHNDAVYIVSGNPLIVWKEEPYECVQLQGLEKEHAIPERGAKSGPSSRLAV